MSDIRMVREGDALWVSPDRAWRLSTEQAVITCHRSHRDHTAEHGTCYGHEDHVYAFWVLARLVGDTYETVGPGPLKRETIARLRFQPEEHA